MERQIAPVRLTLLPSYPQAVGWGRLAAERMLRLSLRQQVARRIRAAEWARDSLQTA